MAPDVVATGLVVGGAELDSMPAILTGLGVYFVGAPVAHIAKGHPLKGLASIGLRTVPAFVLLAGASSGEQGSLGRGLTLAGISALAVMMIDAQALAWEDVPRTAGFEVLSASVTIDKNRVSASVGGVF